jgi:hypothetical protein
LREALRKETRDSTTGLVALARRSKLAPISQSVSANAHTLNKLTAQTGEDGSITVQFGGYDGKTPNCLPITPGWNYLVRPYRLRKDILDGTWRFPDELPAR